MIDTFTLIPQALVVLPLLCAIILILWRRTSVYRHVFSAVILAVMIILSFEGLRHTLDGEISVSLVGGWTAPYGIILVMDTLSALFLLSVNIVFLSSVIYSFYEDSSKVESSTRLPLIFFLQTGVTLSLLTGDFFNLFVGIEVMLCASYSLMALCASKKKLFRMFDYMTLSMTGSFLLLVMAGCTYAFTGHLNMAGAASVLINMAGSPQVYILGFLTLLIFGLKAGIFPLYFWLPDSYPILPPSLAGLFGGVLTKVGYYILIRLFVTMLPHNLDQLYLLAGVIAGFTMFFGVIGAVGKQSIKGILSYHILSQTGYMIFGLAMFTPKAIAGGIYFAIHNILVKSSLFLLGGIGQHCFGTDSLKKMGGLWQLIPVGGFLFFIQAMSLAGIPPLSGFWGKYLIILEAINQKYWILTSVAVATSFFTFFSMIKIWTMAFMGPVKSKGPFKTTGLVASSLVLVITSLLLFLCAEFFMENSTKASEQIFDQSLYHQAVYAKTGKGV